MDELYDAEHMDNPYQDLGAEYWQTVENLVNLDNEKKTNFCLTFIIPKVMFWKRHLQKTLEVVR
jgi:hypothetical protein